MALKLPVVRVVLIALAVFATVMLGWALIESFGQRAPDDRFRLYLLGVVFGTALLVIVAARLRSIQRKRAIKAELQGDSPVRLPVVKRPMVVAALLLLLLSAASSIEIDDPALTANDRVDPVLVAFFAGAAGLLAAAAAALRSPPLIISKSGIAYPLVWEGTISWPSIKHARAASLFGVDGVVIALHAPQSNPLSGQYRKIAQRLALKEEERPIPAATFDVALEDLLARITRGEVRS